ncbi:PREDICTED: protein transport protein Sec16A-like [Amphimedon queenslandica]|uniref:Sec16 Sec23-binding domain-containing protein n=1 Tax=Amphimedon queenslandica TaxID=400682 RepID=A0AAN0JUK7_AMPQE|nr:PREDICTED: protein transport protein Sec16A-like [Amphimedon queenslandica]|eukprot:XP_019860577.1 PREDICTED: protein transport protein Sec16A-like [Amphimedon queenslandica]
MKMPPAAGSPSPPRRDTPLCFCFPHVSVRFSIGGQLVTGSPVKPSEHVPAIVHIHSLQSLVPEFNNFAESLEDYPGPLLISDTPKSAVIKFCTSRASAETDPDHALLWKYLSLLCQQNGVVLPTDISDLLTQQENEDNLSKSPRGVGVGGAIEEKGCGLDEFRTLLLAGRKKDALNLACSRGLWGHALMLSSRMDDQSRTYVVNRFTASLLTSDPLSTFYTLMLGRLPSVSKPEGLSRSGDWQSHLAMMITNLNPTQDTSCISNLGDSLLARGRVAGAHFCYHLCNIPFGSYGDTETSKYSLLGIDHTNIMRGCYPSPEDLVRTEVLEFALGLSKAEFVLPNFQTFKLLHLFKLIEAGLTKKALSYCESISWFVIRSPSSFNNTFLQLLTDFSVRLHYASYPSGVMENELPPWILTLDQSVGDNSFMGGVSPANVISRASPSLSSAAGLAAAASHQPLLPSSYTTQEYLQVPGGGAGGGASVQYPVPEGYSTTVEPVTEVTTGDAGDTGQYTGYTAPVGYAVASEDTTDYTGYVPPSNVQATGYVPPSNVQATGYVPPSSVQATGYVPPSIADSIAQSTVANTGEQLPVPAVTATDATGFQGITEPPANPNPMVYSTAEQETLPDQYGSLMNYQQPWAQSWDTGTSTIPESQSAGMHGGESLESSSGLMSSSSQVDVVRSIHGFNGYNSSSTLMGDSSTVFTAPPTDNKPHLPSEGNKEKSNENEEDVPNNTKDVDKDKVAADSKSWLGRLNPFNLIPKGPKQGYLPDDKNPRIIFDKEKNRWIDLDADDQNDSGPAPPPTDSELKSTTGISSTSGGVGRPGGGARGRLAKARYVDVARSNKTQSTAPPPPALAPPPGGLMPLAQGMQFNLFVPAQPNQQNDGVSNFETLYNPVPVPSTSDTPPTATNESLSNTVTPSEVTPSSSSHTIQPQEHLGPSMAVSRFPPSQNPHHIPQDQSSLSVYQTPAAPATGHQPHLPPAPPPQSRTERRTASESSDVSIGVPEAQDKMEPPKPQFFNPNDFTNMRRTAATAPHQRSDPFPDNVSDASVLSEFSQEVSQINKQAMSRQRLRPGSRPRYQYPPSSWQQGQPRPTQAPPPGPQGNWL